MCVCFCAPPCPHTEREGAEVEERRGRVVERNAEMYTTIRQITNISFGISIAHRLITTFIQPFVSDGVGYELNAHHDNPRI